MDEKQNRFQKISIVIAASTNNLVVFVVLCVGENEVLGGLVPGLGAPGRKTFSEFEAQISTLSPLFLCENAPKAPLKLLAMIQREQSRLML